MAKIDGKYEQKTTERLLEQITCEDSITKRHHLISRYLHQRYLQIEKVLANIEDDDIDLTMVIEQLWEDLELAHKQICTLWTGAISMRNIISWINGMESLTNKSL